MPSGKLHDRITFFSLPWVTGGSFLITLNIYLTGIVACAFLFSGLMFGPDLDIYSVQFQRWGKLRWLWLPYQNILHHRSQLSHGPIIGTILRIIYLIAFCLPVAIFTVGIAQFFAGFSWNWQKFAVYIWKYLLGAYREEALALFIGLELGAMSHYCSDWIMSAEKKSQRKRKHQKRSKSSL